MLTLRNSDQREKKKLKSGKDLDRVSYSTIMHHINCGRFFKLAHLDQIDIFDHSIHTTFGKLVHEYIGHILLNLITPKEAKEQYYIEISQYYLENMRDTARVPESLSHDFWVSVGGLLFDNVKNTFKGILEAYEILAVEELIVEPAIEDKYSQNFKGFIDIVIRTKNNKIIIADFKTCKSAFLFKKYCDKEKEMQIVLYKHYYSIKYDIPLKDIETYFILLEKNPKSKKPVQFYRVTSAKRKLQNRLKILDNRLNAINNDIYFKNRLSCKYCKFYKTEYCS